MKMPIYEYKCEKCGNQFVLRKELNEAEKGVKCPLCGAEDSRRVFSTFGTCQGCGPVEPRFARGGG